MWQDRARLVAAMESETGSSILILSKAVSLAALMALHTIQYPREPNYPEERESERPMITVAGYG